MADQHEVPGMRPSADSEAAYTLARLTARRGVRAAMAVSALRAGGIASAREVWRRPSVVDEPTSIASSIRYPDLRVGHLGDGGLAAASAPCIPLGRGEWRTRLDRVRPELVLVDAATDLSDAQLRQLLGHARTVGSRIAAFGAGAERVRASGLTKQVDAIIDTTDPRGSVGPWVDHRRANPMGRDASSTSRRELDPGNDPVSDAQLTRTHAVATAPLRGAADRHAAAVLAALAVGTPVVATRTPLLERLLAPIDDLLVDEGDLDAVATELVADPAALERSSVRLRRHVLQNHASTSAFERLLEQVDIDRRPPPRISVLASTRRPELLAAFMTTIDAQDHPSIDIQLVLHGVDADIPERALSPGRLLSVHRVGAEQPLGVALNTALDAATGEFMAKMDDDDLYGPRHLSDLLVALDYSGAEAVGRWSNVVHLVDVDRTVHQHVERQERWAHHLPGATMLVRGDVLRSLRWRRVPRGVDTELVRAIHGSGGRCYSTHRFGFIRRRHGDHTFDRSDRGFGREGTTRPGLDGDSLHV